MYLQVLEAREGVLQRQYEGILLGAAIAYVLYVVFVVTRIYEYIKCIKTCALQ